MSQTRGRMKTPPLARSRTSDSHSNNLQITPRLLLQRRSHQPRHLLAVRVLLVFMGISMARTGQAIQGPNDQIRGPRRQMQLQRG